MPRFVLLAHDHPTPHFDFMLESGDALRTWRIDQIPAAKSQQAASPLPDHRLAYLEYEGPVSGNRGHVKRVDRGEYSIISESSEAIEVEISGVLLRGHARLEKHGEHWLFSWSQQA